MSVVFNTFTEQSKTSGSSKKEKEIDFAHLTDNQRKKLLLRFLESKKRNQDIVRGLMNQEYEEHLKNQAQILNEKNTMENRERKLF
jgi:hypothetical protein